MADLPCRELNCTQCCQWGDEASTLKPTGVDPDPEGNCPYLIKGKGCALFGRAERPLECVFFDCRELAKEFLKNPIVAVVAASIRLNAYMSLSQNDQNELTGKDES